MHPSELTVAEKQGIRVNIARRMIPRSAKPHEVAILLFWLQGMNAKQIAYELHYKKLQPVYRVIAKWELVLSVPQAF
jgi:hypothetical protein